MDLNRGQTKMMLGTSAISCVSCLPAIISLLIFPELQSKTYYQMIFYLNIAVLFTSCGSLVGEPVDESAACWFEGIMTNIFTLSSVFWTVIISWMIFSIVVFEKQVKINYFVHVITIYYI